MTSSEEVVSTWHDLPIVVKKNLHLFGEKRKKKTHLFGAFTYIRDLRIFDKVNHANGGHKTSRKMAFYIGSRRHFMSVLEPT